jgi:hypothetical protein
MDVQGKEYSDSFEDHMDKDIEEYEKSQSINTTIDLSPTANTYNNIINDHNDGNDELTVEELYKGLGILKKYLPDLLQKVELKEINNIHKKLVEIASLVLGFKPWNTSSIYNEAKDRKWYRDVEEQTSKVKQELKKREERAKTFKEKWERAYNNPDNQNIRTVKSPYDDDEEVVL